MLGGRIGLPALRAWAAEMGRFSSVGTASFLLDLAVFNFLRFGPGELLGNSPLTAKVVSVAASTIVAWLGSRYWTFSGQRRDSRARELISFVLVTAGGLLVSLSCLAFCIYVLGLTSPLAENIAANVVGQILGTIFRYYFYKRLVFTGRPLGLIRESNAAKEAAAKETARTAGSLGT